MSLVKMDKPDVDRALVGLARAGEHDLYARVMGAWQVREQRSPGVARLELTDAERETLRDTCGSPPVYMVVA